MTSLKPVVSHGSHHRTISVFDATDCLDPRGDTQPSPSPSFSSFPGEEACWLCGPWGGAGAGAPSGPSTCSSSPRTRCWWARSRASRVRSVCTWALRRRSTSCCSSSCCSSASSRAGLWSCSSTTTWACRRGCSWVRVCACVCKEDQAPPQGSSLKAPWGTAVQAGDAGETLEILVCSRAPSPPGLGLGYL